MKAKTLKALKGSIAKWEGILAGTGEDDGTDSCPLCGLFFYNDCYGCVVSQEAEKQGCAGTPYFTWLDHQDDAHGLMDFPMSIECPECRKIARRELNFLKRLLPNEKA